MGSLPSIIPPSTKTCQRRNSAVRQAAPSVGAGIGPHERLAEPLYTRNPGASKILPLYETPDVFGPSCIELVKHWRPKPTFKSHDSLLGTAAACLLDGLISVFIDLSWGDRLAH